MKICSNCDVEKANSEFSKRGSGLHSWCRPCKREYDNNYYANNDGRKEQIRSAKKQISDNNKHKMFELLSVSVCSDCGIDDWRVLEFDHLHSKKKNIAHLMNGYTWDRILEEIYKCEIVCSNCHRIRTYDRDGSWRVNYAGLAQW